MIAGTIKSETTRASPKHILAGYICVMVLAEICLVFVSVAGGALIYATLLAVMLAHGAFGANDTEASPRVRGPAAVHTTRAVIALSFVPVARLVTVSMPFEDRSYVFRSALIGVPLLAGIVWGAWVVRLPGMTFRPHYMALELAVGFLAFPLAIVGYFILRPESTSSSWTRLVASGVAVSLAALVEEAIYRGFILTALARVYAWSAPLWSSAVYVVSYLGVRPAGIIALALVTGLLFSWAVTHTKSLLGVTLGHSLLNVYLFVVLPASGLRM